MRFLPLIWAALRRKPVRSILTFLSVTVAFTLFGLMIGLSDTMKLMEARAHAERIWTMPRFDMSGGMPIAVARRIAQVPGVKKTTVMYYLQGYVGDPKNHATIFFLDDEYGRIFPDWGPSPEQWDLIRRDRTAMVISRKWAAQFHKKAGDSFTMIAPDQPRADGRQAWTFKIAAVGEESTQNTGGYAMANYTYFDESLPPASRGRISEVDMAADPAKVETIAAEIDRIFANSGSPTSSQPEKVLYTLGNNWGGVDVNAVTHDIALVGLLMILYLTSSVLAKSVRERLSEFATLKSFGFTDGAVIGLVAAEAALPCLAGALCGVAVAGFLAWQIPALMPADAGMPLPTISPPVFVWALACAGLVALISAILPSLRLARLDVAAALSERG